MHYLINFCKKTIIKKKLLSSKKRGIKPNIFIFRFYNIYNIPIKYHIPIISSSKKIKYTYTSKILNKNTKLTQVTIRYKLSKDFYKNLTHNDGLSFKPVMDWFITKRGKYDLFPKIKTNCTIEKFGNIPLSRKGMQFYAMSLYNLVFLKTAGTPTIIKNTSLEKCFSNTSFNNNINNWNVKNVINMSYMFYNNSWLSDPNMLYFNQPLHAWNVSNVTNMNNMFGFAKEFNQTLDYWNVSRVTNMSYMFISAENFNQLLGYWNVSNVTNMSYMFDSAKSFNQSLNSWNVSNVTNMSYMFISAENFNQPLNSWNVSKVTNMSYMFNFAKNFNQPLGSWNVSNVKRMDYMFSEASSFNQKLSDWTLTNISKTIFSDGITNIFNNALVFNNGQPSGDKTTPLGYGWNNVANYSYPFKDNSALTDENADPVV